MRHLQDNIKNLTFKFVFQVERVLTSDNYHILWLLAKMDVLTVPYGINSGEITKPYKVALFPSQHNHSALLTTFSGKTASGTSDTRGILIHISTHRTLFLTLMYFKLKEMGFFFNKKNLYFW